MNCPSRTDEVLEADRHNQSPNALSNDLTTNQDLNGIANSRVLREGDSLSIQSAGQTVEADRVPQSVDPHGGDKHERITNTSAAIGQSPPAGAPVSSPSPASAPASSRVDGSSSSPTPPNGSRSGSLIHRGPPIAARLKKVLLTFGKFVGPGFMIAVAYIDPGNYATDIAAGASYRFRLLFIVLLSNLFAIFLQSLCIKLGTVTGLNLAQACRAFLPRWLNYVLYVMAEIAIIATDIAEVIGTAIAINLLIPKIPLVAGCAISILDVMVILFFYQPNGAMRGLRAFEFFVVLLVLGVVICFCIQLSMIDNTPVGDVFKGYLPSSAIVEQKGLYQACGILGATVMPHSLYLGSGIVQPRLRDYDQQKGLLPPEPRSSNSSTHEDSEKMAYMPSLSAIQHSMKYSITELAISLFTFALFVNSAILIVAGASLYQNQDAQDADIFGIHDLLSKSLSPAAGTIFALALLLSGVSAGIVCTIAGQMVSEGALNLSMRPWLRRLITRSISITPSIIIAGAVGRSGLDAALNGSQVALSVVLPFVTAPLIYFTCLNKYMTVLPGNARLYVPGDPEGNGIRAGIIAATGIGDSNTSLGAQDIAPASVKMANSIVVAILAVLIWLIMASMNVANLVLLGKGD